MYKKFATKVNVTDIKVTGTSQTVSERQFDSEKQNLKKKIKLFIKIYVTLMH